MVSSESRFKEVRRGPRRTSLNLLSDDTRVACSHRSTLFAFLHKSTSPSQHTDRRAHAV